MFLPPPRSTKVPLGSNVDFNIHNNISEWDLGTPGGIGPYIKKWYIIMVYGLNLVWLKTKERPI